MTKVALNSNCLKCPVARSCPKLMAKLESFRRQGIGGLAGLVEVDDEEAVRKNLPEGITMLTGEDAFAHIEKMVGGVQTRALRRKIDEKQEIHEAVKAVREQQAGRIVCSRCTCVLEMLPDDGMAICDACREELRDEARNQSMRENFERNYGSPEEEPVSETTEEGRMVGVDLGAGESESVEQPCVAGAPEQVVEAEEPPPAPEPTGEDAPVPPKDRRVD